VRPAARSSPYIPNNAYLVRLPNDAAQRLNALPEVQSVLAYEPYYKLKTDLLRFAVDQTVLPLGQRLNVALFADAREGDAGRDQAKWAR